MAIYIRHPFTNCVVFTDFRVYGTMSTGVNLQSIALVDAGSATITPTDVSSGSGVYCVRYQIGTPNNPYRVTVTGSDGSTDSENIIFVSAAAGSYKKPKQVKKSKKRGPKSTANASSNSRNSAS